MQDDTSQLPDEAWLVALVSLRGVGPARLAALRSLASQGQSAERLSSQELWRWLAGVGLGGGRVPGGHTWLSDLAAAARATDVGQKWQQHADTGAWVVGPDHPAWPDRLVRDPEPPAVLFGRGQQVFPHGSTVAIVGTRRCSPYGREVATQLGAELARAGVHVVSGLAMGIDAAAHRGAVEAVDQGGGLALGVLGAGFDRPVPQPNVALYRRVCEVGVVLSETPLAQSGARWRFPARNRIIAALSDAVVVVESPAKGGSLYTVDEALRRDRPVLAVPGSIFSGPSVGTNRLIADGAIPCLGACDVLEALPDLIRGDAAGQVALNTGPQSALSASAAEVLAQIVGESAALDDILARSAMTPTSTIGALHELESGGWVRRAGSMVWRTRSP